MTLANKLTLFRIALVPVMVVIAFIPFFNETYFFKISLANLINVIIFSVASLTDLIDGRIARKTNTVTTFGKFLDPIADKLLVNSALIILCVQFVNTNNWWFLPAWIVIFIIAREFIISGVRLIAASKGVVIAAGEVGKWKTTAQMAAIICLFMYQVPIFIEYIFGYVGAGLIYIATVLAIISMIEYIYNSRKILFESI